MKKVQNLVFPLASSANRAELINGLMDGVIKHSEAQAALVLDLSPRPHKKPVVAEGTYFPSVTDAAKAIVAQRLKNVSKDIFFKAVQSEQKRISRWCSQDCWEGYYWAE